MNYSCPIGFSLISRPILFLLALLLFLRILLVILYLVYLVTSDSLLKIIESLGTGSTSPCSLKSSTGYSSTWLLAAFLLKQITRIIITITAAPTPIPINIAILCVSIVTYSDAIVGGSIRASVVYDCKTTYPTVVCMVAANDPFCINRFTCCWRVDIYWASAVILPLADVFVLFVLLSIRLEGKIIDSTIVEPE